MSLAPLGPTTGVDFDALRRHQEGTFAVWQLRFAGWSRGRIRHATRRLREVHHGVFVTGDAPLTERQRCWAAVLTEPGTYLSHASMGRLAGFDDWRTSVTTVTRPGSGGTARYGDVLVHRSSALGVHDVGTLDGLPCLRPARTVLDLVAQRREGPARRVVRNALRVEAVTGMDLRLAVARGRGRRGVARLRQYVDDYAHLPLHRTKSDAEALALAVLDGAKVPIPLVNVTIHGEEADLTWWDARWIVELDGGQWHHPVEDARKQAVWERTGFSVHRLPTDDVYFRPQRLLALTPPNVR